MKQKLKIGTARTLIKCLLVLAVALCAVDLIIGGGFAGFRAAAGPIALLCVICSAILLVTAIRCPFCSKTIIRNALGTKVCPHCGRNLVTGAKGKKSRR